MITNVEEAKIKKLKIETPRSIFTLIFLATLQPLKTTVDVHHCHT
jgi:hypothetical protein